ncbi:MAG: bifunctional nuclease family protein [Simkania negevensis]|nr:bifunctional nuclease family protein [Simkania negevensis]
MEIIPIDIVKIDHTPIATLFLLGTKEKQFALYASPNTGEAIKKEMNPEHPSRLYTHNLISSILSCLNAKISKVILWDVNDTVYQARLFLEQQIEGHRTIIEIDARPSDCLTLAIQNDAPIFCRKELFEKALKIDIEET